MADFKKFKSKIVVEAQQVSANGSIATIGGVVAVNAGDWLVKEDEKQVNGNAGAPAAVIPLVRVVPKDQFEAEFEEV